MKFGTHFVPSIITTVNDLIMQKTMQTFSSAHDNSFVSDIAIFVLKRDVKLQLTNDNSSTL